MNLFEYLYERKKNKLLNKTIDSLNMELRACDGRIRKLIKLIDEPFNLTRAPYFNNQLIREMGYKESLKEVLSEIKNSID